MANLPSGTVTFLFTDIEGSTKLAQEHPDTWESLRARHHQILQFAMDAHNGYVFQIIGAGILAYIDLLMGNEKDVKQRLRQGLEASLEYLEQSPNMPSPWLIIEGQARLDVVDGHMERAAQLFGASWVQREVDDSPLT